MKIPLKPCIIFLLSGFILLSGCSHLPVEREIRTASIKTGHTQPAAVVVTPTKTLPPAVGITAAIGPLPSLTPTVPITPTPNLSNPVVKTDPSGEKILNDKNLRKFIPELKELPDRARYWICKGCENIVTNQEIIWSWGKEKADNYISETGRINGWSIMYVRGSLEIYSPEYLTLTVQIYNTAAGASLFVNKFNALQVFPDAGWYQESCQVDFSHDCVYIKKINLDRSGRETVVSRLYFSYHNLAAVVTGEGWPEDVTPEMLEDLAYKMYQKMVTVPLAPYTALTPTH